MSKAWNSYKGTFSNEMTDRLYSSLTKYLGVARRDRPPDITVHVNPMRCACRLGIWLTDETRKNDVGVTEYKVDTDREFLWQPCLDHIDTEIHAKFPDDFVEILFD